MNIGTLAAGIIAVVLGAMMLLEGIVASVPGETIFFEGTNHNFAFAVAILALILGTFLLDEGRKE